MTQKTTLVVTSIAAPNAVMKDLANGCREHGWEFIVIGDDRSPAAFELQGCRYFGVPAQRALDFRFARECPIRNYARKNIGFLIAMKEGAPLIIETDDDNFPRPDFWATRNRRQSLKVVADAGWVNVYRYFTDATIWPRGLPLDDIHKPLPPFDSLVEQTVDCPIQQGLADENPDVDAIYRLAMPLPISFRSDRRIALFRNAWCPFNSQNTTWWRDTFALLYLPAYCSTRMTDIWRSFIAQRIAWENDWGICHHEPTVWQERNEHNLMRDFADEVSGYLHNREISDALMSLPLQPGVSKLNDNLRLCYEELVRLNLVGDTELALLDAWIADIEEISGVPR